jgi:c-di-GMP-binding flagellar brake protein YcgR
MQERRRSQRIPVQQSVSISLGDGGGLATAVSENISSGGAFFYSDRYISAGSEVGLILVLPREVTLGEPVRVWCVTKVVRVESQLKEGKFGVALEFLSFQVLSQA